MSTDKNQIVASLAGPIFEAANSREAFVKHLEYLSKHAMVASCVSGAGCCGGAQLQKETIELRAQIAEQLKMIKK